MSSKRSYNYDESDDDIGGAFMSWSDNEGYGDLSVQDIHEAQSDVDPYEHLTMLRPSTGLSRHTQRRDVSHTPSSRPSVPPQSRKPFSELSERDWLKIQQADEHALMKSGNSVYLGLKKEVERLRSLNESLQLAVCNLSSSVMPANKPQSAPTQSTSSQHLIIPEEYEQYTLPRPAQKRPSHSLLFTREEFKKWRSQFQKLSAEGRAGKKYEWLRDFNGVEVPQERVMDIKREAREILDAMYDGPLHQRKTWHQILHSHRIRGVAVLESKFPELTQCQGHAMADHILAECRHRQLERYRAGDRRREKRLKVEEDAGKERSEEQRIEVMQRRMQALFQDQSPYSFPFTFHEADRLSSFTDIPIHPSLQSSGYPSDSVPTRSSVTDARGELPKTRNDVENNTNLNITRPAHTPFRANNSSAADSTTPKITEELSIQVGAGISVNVRHASTAPSDSPLLSHLDALPVAETTNVCVVQPDCFAADSPRTGPGAVPVRQLETTERNGTAVSYPGADVRESNAVDSVDLPVTNVRPYAERTALPPRTFTPVAAPLHIGHLPATKGATTKRILGGREMYKRFRMEQCEQERAAGKLVAEPDFKKEYTQLSLAEKADWNRRWKEQSASTQTAAAKPSGSSTTL
ncbi:hypothetical protein BT69DRAFT_1315493 [Atractiella rhizophila]|nr:hypothetical protein BT69DRAFT_1315493 [Atractiella rhizophila]